MFFLIYGISILKQMLFVLCSINFLKQMKANIIRTVMHVFAALLSVSA